MKKNSNLDLFDPRTAVMDSDHSPENAHSHGDFGFAFNDSNFSDRVLRIKIVSEDDITDDDCCTRLADWARNRKRRREDSKKEIDTKEPKKDQQSETCDKKSNLLLLIRRHGSPSVV